MALEPGHPIICQSCGEPFDPKGGNAAICLWCCLDYPEDPHIPPRSWAQEDTE